MKFIKPCKLCKKRTTRKDEICQRCNRKKYIVKTPLIESYRVIKADLENTVKENICTIKYIDTIIKNLEIEDQKKNSTLNQVLSENA